MPAIRSAAFSLVLAFAAASAHAGYDVTVGPIVTTVKTSDGESLSGHVFSFKTWHMKLAEFCTNSFLCYPKKLEWRKLMAGAGTTAASVGEEGLIEAKTYSSPAGSVQDFEIDFEFTWIAFPFKDDFGIDRVCNLASEYNQRKFLDRIGRPMYLATTPSCRGDTQSKRIDCVLALDSAELAQLMALEMASCRSKAMAKPYLGNPKFVEILPEPGIR